MSTVTLPTSQNKDAEKVKRLQATLESVATWAAEKLEEDPTCDERREAVLELQDLIGINIVGERQATFNVEVQIQIPIPGEHSHFSNPEDALYEMGDSEVQEEIMDEIRNASYTISYASWDE